MEPNTYAIGDALTVMESFQKGGKQVQGVVTSPPYNLGLRSRKGQVSNWKNGQLADKGYQGHSDNFPRAEYVEWQRKVIALSLEIVGPKGVVLWQHKPVHRDLGVLEQNDILQGFSLRQRIIWNRGSTNNHTRSICPPTYEFIAVIAPRGYKMPAEAYKESRSWGAVWNIPPERNPHEAPFPLELARRMVMLVPGAVLDPFAGSGTVGLAALAQEKNYYLVDNAERNRLMFTNRVHQWTEKPSKLKSSTFKNSIN